MNNQNKRPDGAVDLQGVKVLGYLDFSTHKVYKTKSKVKELETKRTKEQQRKDAERAERIEAERLAIGLTRLTAKYKRS